MIRKSAGTAEGEGDGEAAEGTSISCVDTHGESIYTYEVTFDGGRGKDISTVNRYTGAGKLTDSYTLDGFDAFLEPGSEQKQDDSSASEASPEGAASALGVSGEQNASPEQGASAESAGQAGELQGYRLVDQCPRRIYPAEYDQQQTCDI